MKYLTFVILMLASCSSSNGFTYKLEYYDDFNTMSQDIFVRNVRDCRKQSLCKAEDLFDHFYWQHKRI